ncbi:RNA recognition motif domain-containing protein [Terrimonas pollutisoli]|uniref:RNA recognition motif domain-containing protein n=1 Tax=Terrimonas pollutisoli TaxID=3034147 RepID=UPI0023EABFCB|nr:RNA-binding protein [Terrimonas sp. H1YJ31]
MNLFVAGLPYDLDDDELMEIFEKFGVVNSAKVAIDKETGKSRGFGFVDMQNDAEARDAIENLNDISLGKKPLVVKQADERSGGGGSSFGGGGGNRDRGGGFNRGGFNSRPGGNRPGGSSRPGPNRDSRDRNRY